MRTSVRITSAKRYKTFVSSDKAWGVVYAVYADQGLAVDFKSITDYIR